MARKQRNGTSSKKGARTVPRRARVAKTKAVLDSNGSKYARLLVDPIGAPLAYPIQQNGDTGFLLRADSTIAIGGGPTHTGGYIMVSPGTLGSGNVEIVYQHSVGGTAVAAAATIASIPGKTFLNTNAQAARPVAMAIQAMYLGTEFDRGGYIYYGQCNAGLIAAGTTYQVTGVGPTLENFERVPADIVQVNWKPSDGDLGFNSPSVAATDVSQNSAVAFAFEGLTAGKGIMFKMTVVWEWLPIATSGLAIPSVDASKSQNSLGQVITTIENTGYRWTEHLSQAMTAGVVAGLMGGLRRGAYRNRIEL